MPKVKSDDLIKELYLKIREMILDGQLSPGEKLTQEELANKLGVSRTPLLRALQLLEGDMLLVSIPRRGMYVRKMTLVELRDAFQLRCAVESLASELAAVQMKKAQVKQMRDLFAPFADDLNQANLIEYQKADHAFHSMILQGSGNEIIRKMPVINNILKITYQYGLIRLPYQTYREHMAIIDGIEAKDPVAASKAMREHLGHSVLTLEARMADSKK
jgi:DNA-binding GntR family transcriptional regulator